ncbi:hypothetical protein QFZ96_007779 [Paraburkholderia youngii]
MPSGRCSATNASWVRDTVATMPTPMNSIATISGAIVQCSSRASGLK